MASRSGDRAASRSPRRRGRRRAGRGCGDGGRWQPPGPTHGDGERSSRGRLRSSRAVRKPAVRALAFGGERCHSGCFMPTFWPETLSSIVILPLPTFGRSTHTTDRRPPKAFEGLLPVGIELLPQRPEKDQDTRKLMKVIENTEHEIGWSSDLELALDVIGGRRPGRHRYQEDQDTRNTDRAPSPSPTSHRSAFLDGYSQNADRLIDARDPRSPTLGSRSIQPVGSPSPSSVPCATVAPSSCSRRSSSSAAWRP
jgi:hypothetical protein